jgi:hypothetical protein
VQWRNNASQWHRAVPLTQRSAPQLLQEMHELCFLRRAREGRAGRLPRGRALVHAATNPHGSRRTRFARAARALAADAAGASRALRVPRSTIYLLIVGTLAVAGIPSAGPVVHPARWQRDVWAGLWVVRRALGAVLAACALHCTALRAALA